MNICKRTLKEININGTAVTAVSGEVTAHLEVCDSCAAAFREALSGVVGEPAPVRTLEVTPPPPAFLEAEDEQDIPARPVFVARERELAQLEAYLDRALGGQGGWSLSPEVRAGARRP